MRSIKAVLTVMMILGQQPLASGAPAKAPIVPVGKNAYIWSNDKGFIDAKSCNREIRSDIRFRIANDPDDGASTKFEAMLDNQGKSVGKKVSRRSLVKIMGNETITVKSGGEDLEMEQIEVVGVQPGLKGNGVAKRTDAGFLPADSLDPVMEYMIQLTDEITLVDEDSNDKVVLGNIPGTNIRFVDGFLEAETEDTGYVVFKCDGKDYNVFNLHIGSPNDPVAQIAVNWDETKVLRNINVVSLNEAEELIGELQVAFNKKKAADAAAAQAAAIAKYKAEHPDQNPNLWTSLTNIPYSDVNSPMIFTGGAICTNDEDGSVFLRDENIDAVSENGTAIKIANGETISLVPKAQPITAAGKTYVQVEYKGKRGFVSAEYVYKSKANCPSLNVRYICTIDGDPLSVRDDANLENILLKIDNVTKVGLLGPETKEFNKLKFIKIRSLEGAEEGWVAQDYLKTKKSDCASAGADVSGDSGGSLVTCLQREMPKTIITRKCGDRNGVCNMAKKWRKSGTKATGQCARFVNNGILRCGGSKSYMGCNAKDCGGLLKSAGFTKLSVKDPEKAPLGAVIVYDSKCGNPYGHIEIRLKNHAVSSSVKHDDYGFYSDYLGNAVKGRAGWWGRNEVTSCRPVKSIWFKANQTSKEIHQP